MKIEPQKSPNLSQLGQLIKDMSVGMLTNLNDDGELVSRPMSAQTMCAEGHIWFLVDQYSNKVKHLQPMNLAFSNESNSTYVSISGVGAIVIDRDLIEKMWTNFAKPWFPDGVNSTNLGLLKFTPDSVDFWDAPSCKMVRLFAMAASIVTAKPMGMGEHGHLEMHA
jgi:general stress protein 26